MLNKHHHTPTTTKKNNLFWGRYAPPPLWPNLILRTVLKWSGAYAPPLRRLLRRAVCLQQLYWRHWEIVGYLYSYMCANTHTCTSQLTHPHKHYMYTHHSTHTYTHIYYLICFENTWQLPTSVIPSEPYSIQ
jgi:hypothetical protein